MLHYASYSATPMRILACPSNLLIRNSRLRAAGAACTNIPSVRWASNGQATDYSFRNANTSSITSAAMTSFSALNPPQSTLPPPLSLPAREPEQSTPSYLFATGKAYVRFYKEGLKAVWANGKAARALRRAKLSGSPHAMNAAGKRIITRGEWHLLLRSAADHRKIPMFALLFALCGEFTPLVVVFASPLVPWTCRIPKQVQLERRRKQERRHLSFHDIGEERLRTAGEAASWHLDALKREEILHIGRCLALYGKIWDTLGGFPIFLLRRRLKRRFEYLELDDQLIQEGGGSEGLLYEELVVACEERGLDVLHKDGTIKPAMDLQQQFEHCFQNSQQFPRLRQLLLRQEKL